MLALRAVKLPSRQCSILSLTSILETHSRFHLINKQQSRHYLFIPVSWEEARERLERWLEQRESRFVKVSLLKRIGRNPALRASNAQEHRSKIISQKHRHRNRQKPKNSNYFNRNNHLLQSNQIKSKSLLPLPSSDLSLPSLEVLALRKAYQRWKVLRKNQYQLWKDRRKEQYQGWKSRRRAQYQGWKSRRQAQYQGWKSRRQAQYQRWNVKQTQEWIKKRRVLLKEYSKSEWFDALGRPLTARDSTGRFVNPWQSQSTNGVHSLGTILRWRWQRLVRETVNFFSRFILCSPSSLGNSSCRVSSPLLLQEVPPLPSPSNSNLHFTWIGHSTCLFQVKDSFTILTDPMFSKRASPYKTFLGVPRDVPPAYTIQELINHHSNDNSVVNSDGRQSEQDYVFGKVDICCITHDHYDHMDKESVKDLKHHVQLWVVPLGIGDWLVESCSIDRQKIVELQWWQQLRVSKMSGRIVIPHDQSLTDNTADFIDITCCPSSHWGGRNLFDRNTRLWCSFAFSAESLKFFFCGDSGYPKFPLFRQIGDTLGPFDLSCIPIGAYEPRYMNKDSHCNPREAVKIHKDLHSKHSVAIHWGSFQLTEEAMDAPPNELEIAIESEKNDNKHDNTVSSPSSDRTFNRSINFSVLGHGETLVLEEEKSLHHHSIDE